MNKYSEERLMKKYDWYRYLCFILFLVVISQTTVMAEEKPYPNQPITMIIPYGPGGTSDLGSRILTDKMSEFLGQRIIPMNRPGAGGLIGSSFAAKAKPDGYTILNGGTSPIVFLPICNKIDYSLDSFIPVGIYAKIPYWLIIRNDARWKTLKDFVEEERKRPDTLSVSTFGKMTIVDFLLEQLNRQAKVKLKNIPFNSSGQALTSVLGGHTDAAFVTGTGGFLDSGLIRILVIAEEKRLEDFPDIPTFKEYGYQIVISGHFSLMFPKGTAKEIVDKVYDAQKKTIASYGKEIAEKLKKAQIFAVFLNPEDSMKMFKKEHDFMFKTALELGVVAK